VRKGGRGKFQESLPAVITQTNYPVPVRPGLDRFLALLRRVRYSWQGIRDRIGSYLLNKGTMTKAHPPARETDAIHSGDIRDPVPGIESLLLRRRQQRDLLQEGIEGAIADLEDEGTLGRIEEHLKTLTWGGTGVLSTPDEVYAAAFSAISNRIDTLLSYGDALADPARIREHHAMRIAGKRLRYALEAWSDLYRGALADEIGTLKRLQDLLGELHDCDVWIGSIPEFVREEEERSHAFFGDDRHFRNLVPGIRAVLGDRRQQRVHLHEVCLTLWRDLISRGYWEGLREKALRPLIPAPPGGAYRIGLVGGIHGDADALAWVIADGRAQGADLFLNTGDSLGEGHGSGQVVEMIRRKGMVSVIGNLDLQILKEKGSAGKKRRREPVQTPDGINKDSRRYMESLPASIRITIAGKGILLTHGSPLSRAEYLDELTPSERLCGIARESAASAIVSGHSQIPSVRSAGNTLFVNPGSVGRPGDGSPPPNYAILEIAPDGTMTASHHRIEDRVQNR
jgi:predicted phosphodiesterase